MAPACQDRVNDDINEFSNPTLKLCHYFIPSRNVVLGSNLPYLFVRCLHVVNYRFIPKRSLEAKFSN